MPLQGTFDTLAFAELLLLLSDQRASGRLRVRSGDVAADLFLIDGELVMTEAPARGIPSRAEELCTDLLERSRGTFEFQPGVTSPVAATGTVKLRGVLTRARQRLEEWRELRAAVPSLDLRPHVVAELSADHVAIDRERWRVLAVIDGRRSIRSVGHALDLGDFELRRAIKGLLDEGLIEMGAHGAVPGPVSDGRSGLIVISDHGPAEPDAPDVVPAGPAP
jgi:hypothetical protein